MVAIAIDRDCGAEATPRLSLTVTLKINGLPMAVDGVPLMAPEEALRFRPGGREPLLMAQLLYGGVPPLALRLAE
jgi:hypothetical protein